MPMTLEMSLKTFTIVFRPFDEKSLWVTFHMSSQMSWKTVAVSAFPWGGGGRTVCPPPEQRVILPHSLVWALRAHGNKVMNGHMALRII